MMDFILTRITVAVVFTTLALPFLLARCHSRLSSARKFGTDDIFIIAAWILSTTFVVLLVSTYQYGFARPRESVSHDNLIFLAKMSFAQTIIYNASITLCKLSILAQLLNVFLDRSFRIACLFFMIFNVVYILATLFAFIFACRPIHHFWDQDLQGECLDYPIAFCVMSSLGILTDIAICVLPLPVLSQLQLVPKQKYGMMFVFALGGFTCFASVIRLKELIVAMTALAPSTHILQVAMWSSIELNLGIIAGCLPTIRRTLATICPKAFGSADGTTFSQPELNTIPDIEFTYVEKISARSTMRRSLKRMSLSRSLSDMLTRSTTNRTTSYQMPKASTEQGSLSGVDTDTRGPSEEEKGEHLSHSHLLS